MAPLVNMGSHMVGFPFQENTPELLRALRKHPTCLQALRLPESAVQPLEGSMLDTERASSQI